MEYRMMSEPSNSLYFHETGFTLARRDKQIFHGSGQDKSLTPCELQKRMDSCTVFRPFYIVDLEECSCMSSLETVVLDECSYTNEWLTAARNDNTKFPQLQGFVFGLRAFREDRSIINALLATRNQNETNPITSLTIVTDCIQPPETENIVMPAQLKHLAYIMPFSWRLRGQQAKDVPDHDVHALIDSCVHSGTQLETLVLTLYAFSGGPSAFLTPNMLKVLTSIRTLVLHDICTEIDFCQDIFKMLPHVPTMRLSYETDDGRSIIYNTNFDYSECKTDKLNVSIDITRAFKKDHVRTNHKTVEDWIESNANNRYVNVKLPLKLKSFTTSLDTRYYDTDVPPVFDNAKQDDILYSYVTAVYESRSLVEFRVLDGVGDGPITRILNKWVNENRMLCTWSTLRLLFIAREKPTREERGKKREKLDSTPDIFSRRLLPLDLFKLIIYFCTTPPRVFNKTARSLVARHAADTRA